MTAGVSQDLETQRQRRSQVAAVTYELYKEKHVLRQMRGRRLGEEHSPTTFCATSDPDNPVTVDVGWQRPSDDEVEKLSLVRHLQVQQLCSYLLVTVIYRVAPK